MNSRKGPDWRGRPSTRRRSVSPTEANWDRTPEWNQRKVKTGDPGPTASMNMTNGLIKQLTYDQQNTEAAAIILADVAKYGGEGSLTVWWARAFQASQQSCTESRGDLFDTEAA
jgi:hypothetical protein